MRDIRLVALAVVALLAIPVASGQARSPRAPAEFYGVVSQATSFTDEEVGKLRRGRVGAIRFIVPWQRVERIQGTYDWTSIDAKVEAVHQAGARPYPVLFGRPAWSGGEVKDPPLGDYATENAWQDFVAAAVERYGHGGVFGSEHPEVEPIEAWQVWNEPNLPGFWGQATPDAAEYVTLVRLTALAIGDTDPEAEIILAGLSPARKGVPPPEYLADVYSVYEELQVAPDFDIVAVHPYAGRVRDSKQQVREIVDTARVQSGEKQRLVIAEVGWGSGGKRKQLVSGTKEKQARRLSKAFRIFENRRRQWRIESVLWYAWKDIAKGQAACVFCTHVGLFRANGKAKPAWDAFRRTTGAR